jgi:hypothetical protein
MRHLERSEVESKDPAMKPLTHPTGLFDFARNDGRLVAALVTLQLF